MRWFSDKVERVPEARGLFSLFTTSAACWVVLVAAIRLWPAAVEAQERQEAESHAEAAQLTSDGDFKQHLTWSPDGSKFLFTRIHGGKMGLWTMSADGSELKRLLEHDEAPDFDGAWSPDSQRVVFVFDILSGTDGNLELNTINSDGTENQNIISHKAFDESPRWSPDGKKIAFVSTRDGNQEIYLADADGKAESIQRMTSEMNFDNNPSWSPDSQQIAFASNRHGDFEIHAMRVDGSDVRRLTNHAALDYWPVWSPDGRQIAFTSNRDGNYDIYVMSSDGSHLRNLTQHPAQDNFATWSPDGRQVAFISNRTARYEVHVMPVE